MAPHSGPGLESWYGAEGYDARPGNERAGEVRERKALLKTGRWVEGRSRMVVKWIWRKRNKQCKRSPRQISPSHGTIYEHHLHLPLHIMNMDMRLRKAFRYPDESEDEREELDEEEQERVIQQLQRQNEARNAQYSVNSHPQIFA